MTTAGSADFKHDDYHGLGGFKHDHSDSLGGIEAESTPGNGGFELAAARALGRGPKAASPARRDSGARRVFKARVRPESKNRTHWGLEAPPHSVVYSSAPPAQAARAPSPAVCEAARPEDRARPPRGGRDEGPASGSRASPRHKRVRDMQGPPFLALAHCTVRVSSVVPAPLAIVWPVVRKFSELSSWFPRVGAEEVRTELLGSLADGQIGALRRLMFGNLGFVERLEALDDDAHTMKWKVISHPLNTNPFPGSFLNYCATLRLSEVTIDGHTFVEWDAVFGTEHENVELMKADLRRRMEASFQSLAVLLGPGSGGAARPPSHANGGRGMVGHIQSELMTPAASLSTNTSLSSHLTAGNAAQPAPMGAKPGSFLLSQATTAAAVPAHDSMLPMAPPTAVPANNMAAFHGGLATSAAAQSAHAGYAAAPLPCSLPVPGWGAEAAPAPQTSIGLDLGSGVPGLHPAAYAPAQLHPQLLTSEALAQQYVQLAAHRAQQAQHAQQLAMGRLSNGSGLPAGYGAPLPVVSQPGPAAAVHAQLPQPQATGAAPKAFYGQALERCNAQSSLQSSNSSAVEGPNSPHLDAESVQARNFSV